MPRRLALIAALAVTPLVMLVASTATAQQPVEETQAEIGFSQVTATPEMWFYMQERERYDDPAQAVRRNAEARAAQRQARLAACRWYGYSNSRPRVECTPFTGSYIPQGSIGNLYPYFPYRVMVIRTTPESMRR